MYMYTSPTLKLHCKNHFELFLHKTVSAALDIVKHSCKHITIGPLFCLLSKLLLTVVVLDCSCSRRLDCSTLTGSSGGGGSGGAGGGGGSGRLLRPRRQAPWLACLLGGKTKTEDD